VSRLSLFFVDGYNWLADVVPDRLSLLPPTQAVSSQRAYRPPRILPPVPACIPRSLWTPFYLPPYGTTLVLPLSAPPFTPVGKTPNCPIRLPWSAVNRPPKSDAATRFHLSIVTPASRIFTP